MTKETRKEIDLLIYEIFPEDLTPEQMEELQDNRLSWLQTMEEEKTNDFTPEQWERLQQLKQKAIKEENITD